MATEEQIKTEQDTFALQRDYKYALRNLEKIKTETFEIISLKDKTNAELTEKRADLKQVMDDIAQEKVDWAQHRRKELEKLEEKEKEIQTLLKKQSEVEKREQNTADLLRKNDDILQETKRLELKVNNEKVALEAKKRDFETTQKSFSDQITNFETEKKEVKSKLNSLIQQWQEKL